jgi:UDP-N-acetylmuramyl pentapeptide phosphotransferase/UDP-N-acetylglucosamine-1-phosphate transferase
LDNISFLIPLGILSAVLSWAGVRLIRNYALSRQLSLTPEDRAPETPRGGGLAILVIVLLIFMPIGLSFGDPTQVVRFALSSAFIGIIGFLDDLRTLPRWGRIALQILAALVFIPSAPITEIGLPVPISSVTFTVPVSYVVSALWIIAFANTYNYMDGIDGLAGGQAVIAGAFWASIGIFQNDPLVTLLGLLIAGASAGFLVYNLPPASIFLGDVGTTFIGFTLAVLPMLTVSRGGSPRLIVAGALIVGLFLFDAVLTFFRYQLSGQNPSRDYRSHLYQRLIKLGEPQFRVTLLYLLISIGAGTAGIIYWRNNTWSALLVFGIACVILFGWITYRERTTAKQSSSEF